jgi:hypothetical protein
MEHNNRKIIKTHGTCNDCVGNDRSTDVCRLRFKAIIHYDILCSINGVIFKYFNVKDILNKL